MLINEAETCWSQKYRPQRLEDMVLPAPIMDRLVAVRDQEIALPLLLHGRSGTGKTTAARLLNPDSTYFLNCIRLGNALKELELNCSALPLTGGLRVVVFDEADQLTPKAQAALHSMLERLSSTNLFVFTVNDEGRLSGPLRSRLQAIDFTHLSGSITVDEGIRDRCMQILRHEGRRLHKTAIKTIVRDCYPDMRAMLNRLQLESMLTSGQPRFTHSFKDGLGRPYPISSLCRCENIEILLPDS